MRVRCIATQPNEEQRVLLGEFFRSGQVFPVTKGAFYTPVGVGFWSGLTWLEIAANERMVAPVPLFLFEVTDGIPSMLWELRLLDNGGSTLWPPLLYEHAFHDRLANGDERLLSEFRNLRDHLAKEYAER